MEDWPTTFAWAYTASAPGQSPVYGGTPAAAVFYIFVLSIGFFFTLSLFAGVITDEYSRNYDIITGASSLTKAQRYWLETRKLILQYRPDPAINNDIFRDIRRDSWIGKAAQIVSDPWYPSVTLALTCLNLLALMFAHHGQSRSVTVALLIIGNIFVFM